MPDREERRRHHDSFVTHVTQLCLTPAVRAALESGRGRPVIECLDLHPYLSRPTHGHGARRAHYTVSSLIALQRPDDNPAPVSTTPPAPAPPLPDTTTPGAPPAQLPPPADGPDATAAPLATTPPSWRQRPNLGATLASALAADPATAPSAERHLHILTRLSADLLHPRLPHLVRRLLTTGHTPDWAVLLEDLAQWPYRQGETATRWLDAFYLTTPAPHDEEL